MLPLGPSSHALYLAFRVRAFRVSPAPRHRGDFKRNSPFHEVSDPSTYEVWRSDLHWSYQPQLCCTFRVSHPLGALFRSVPFRPCFMPVTPLGFYRLQRLSPAGSVPASQQDLSPLPFCVSLVRGRTRCRDFEDLRTRRIRLSGPVLPGYQSPIRS